MKTLGTLIGLAALFYLVIGALIFFLQRNYIYFPVAKVEHDFEIEQFSNDGETIDVVVLNKGAPGAILYFGGNGENVVANAPAFEEIFPRHTVYLVNYRGYGGSTGKPTEKALYSDALYIHDAVRERHQTMSVIGRSLGCAVATFLASSRWMIEKLVLITPFESAEKIAQDQYPIYPMSLLWKDKYDSTGRAGGISSETLIILAGEDEIIPLKYSAGLVTAFSSSRASVKTIKGAGHNNLSQRSEYYSLLREFL